MPDPDQEGKEKENRRESGRVANAATVHDVTWLDSDITFFAHSRVTHPSRQTFYPPHLAFQQAGFTFLLGLHRTHLEQLRGYRTELLQPHRNSQLHGPQSPSPCAERRSSTFPFLVPTAHPPGPVCPMYDM